MALPAFGRRCFGAGVLLAALAMLLCGQTILEGRLRGVGFLAYWLACMTLTALAVFLAILDVRALRQRIHREQRELLDATLKDIQTDAQRRRGREPHPPPFMT